MGHYHTVRDNFNFHALDTGLFYITVYVAIPFDLHCVLQVFFFCFTRLYATFIQPVDLRHAYIFFAHE